MRHFFNRGNTRCNLTNCKSPDAHMDRKPNRPLHCLGFRLDSAYVSGIWKVKNGSGMHAKSTVICCTQSGQTISRHPVVNQNDGGVVNNLHHASPKQHFMSMSVYCLLVCFLLCSLVVLHGSKCAWCCCLYSINPKGGNWTDIFAPLIRNGGSISGLNRNLISRPQLTSASSTLSFQTHSPHQLPQTGCNSKALPN